ncbi:type II toxin-antitoxin system Phd/YefM family antitoxin [Actinokineospora sp.]|uniref:type II toxin-antitoxin system Phd/YefM family antitoxin n=1 Tax=Actinokineospora sp. TaxID=1872133 RepID=UPI003D6A21E7
MSEVAHWQVQEAKQRFSEVLRAVAREGPQTITKHGEDIAVVIDISEYRRLSGQTRGFVEHLMAFPKIESRPGETDVFDEIEAEREGDLPRLTDFESELDLSDGAHR